MDHPQSEDAQLLDDLAGTLHEVREELPTIRVVFDQAATLLPAAKHISITRRGRRGHLESLGSTSPLADRADQLQYELNEGPCVEAALDNSRGWLHSSDVAVDPRWPTWGPRAAHLGASGILSVQLVERDKSIGAINLYADSPGQFAAREDIELALLWSNHAARALATAHEIAGLQTAIDARHRIGIAQGIIMGHFDIDEDQSFNLLTRLASHTNTKLRDIAQQIVTTRAVPTDPLSSPGSAG